MAVSIHPAHRKMAAITFFNISKDGNGKRRLNMGLNELRLLMPLLLQNLELVQRTDELKHLALEAQVAGDTDWVMELTAQLEQLEIQLM